MDRFILEKKGNWERLEELLAKTDGVSGMKSLPRAEVREFGELYRRAATDLAIARAETRDQKLISYLNSLVIRTHGKIYRAEAKGFRLIWEFFARDFPVAVRKAWKFIALAAAVELFFMFSGMFLIQNDIGFADALGLDEIRIMAENNEQWWLGLNDSNEQGATMLFTHNIRVSFLSFALGALFCVGSFVILALNGLHFGAVLAICYKTNPAFGNALLTFVVGHGLIETFSIYLSAGAGIMIGYALINPGDLSRGDAVRKAGMEAAKIVMGCASVLVVAGIIEGFLSPSSLPPWIKFTTGFVTFTALIVYLALAGRGEKEVEVR
ncbi:MAG: stage II sporulation protein M [Pyrinomonadaceae bacterium]